MFPWIDRFLSRLPRWAVTALAVLGTAIIALFDLRTGFEISLALFYVGPVAAATWGAGRIAGIGIAMLSCLAWLGADLWAGHDYEHPAIALWNALVRLGFFLIAVELLTSLRRQLARERDSAETDALTGLWNVRGFHKRLEHDLALARRGRTPLTLCACDLDDFKRINDGRGHAEGDRVLREFAARVTRSLRATDSAGRLGGDEFALSLPGTDAVGAQQVVARLREHLAAARDPIACSVGVVTFVDAPQSASAALEVADRLMYAVKTEGKNAVRFEAVDLRTHELVPRPARVPAPDA